MKYLLILLFTILFISLRINVNEITNLKSKIQILNDTLKILKVNKHILSYKSEFFDSVNQALQEPALLSKSDSILEIHRLYCIEGDKIYFFKVVLSSDSILQSIYKMGTFINIITGLGINKLIKSENNIIDFATFYKFKESLGKINFFEATSWSTNVDCFGRAVYWEAVIADMNYNYGIDCPRESRFSFAYSYLLKQLNHIETNKFISKNVN